MLGASFPWRPLSIFQMLPTLTLKAARLPALAMKEKMVIKFGLLVDLERRWLKAKGKE
jgi:hypothetical protein